MMMMNSTIEAETVKKFVKKGISNGLLAFIISYAIVTILSIGFNLTAMDHFSKIIQGSIGQELEFSLANVLKISNTLLNFSIFNSVGVLKLGLLILSIIPLIAFSISNHSVNKEHGINLVNGITIITSSFVYALLLMIIGFTAKGEVIGIEVNFVSGSNFMNTLIIAMFFQFVLALFYVKDVHPAVKATRGTVRIVGIMAVILSVISILNLFNGRAVGMLIKIAGLVVMLPNYMAYVMMKNIGMTMTMSESLSTTLEMYQLNINYSPIYIRIIFILITVGVIAYYEYGFHPKDFIVNTILYAEMLGVIVALFAHCTNVNFGVVSFVGEIEFGMDVVLGFIIPMAYVLVVGILVFVIKTIMRLVKE